MAEILNTMKRLALIGLALVLAIFSAPIHAEEKVEDRFVRSGVYVVSSDLAASTAFYEKIFAKAPSLKTPAFVGFDIAGGLFGIADRATFAPKAVRGDNTIPYIQIKDAAAEFGRVKALAPASMEGQSLVREGPLTLFKFTDPDGNIIEFFSFAAPVKP